MDIFVANEVMTRFFHSRVCTTGIFSFVQFITEYNVVVNTKFLHSFFLLCALLII